VGDKTVVDLKKKAPFRTVKYNVTASATPGAGIYTITGKFLVNVTCGATVETNPPTHTAAGCNITCDPTSEITARGSFQCAYQCSWRNALPSTPAISASTTLTGAFGSAPIAWAISFNASDLTAVDPINRCVDTKLYMPLINTTNKLAPLAFEEENGLVCYTVPQAPNNRMGANNALPNPNTQVKTLQASRVFTKASCIDYTNDRNAPAPRCHSCSTSEVAADSDAIWTTTAGIVDPTSGSTIASNNQGLTLINCSKTCAAGYRLELNGKCCKRKATQG